MVHYHMETTETETRQGMPCASSYMDLIHQKSLYKEYLEEIPKKMEEENATEDLSHFDGVDLENYYDVLGLGSEGLNASVDEIKKAYNQLMRRFHHDKAAAHLKFLNGLPFDGETDPRYIALLKAHDTLTNLEKRRGYDSTFDFDETIPTEYVCVDTNTHNIFSQKKPLLC
jgi:hypothetical protein